MAIQKNKMRLLWVMEILNERTDEQHVLSAADLIEILESEYGLEADRKAIYSDVLTLQEYGMDILQQRGRAPGYYVASRKFELPELKLLVDAVQASKSLTESKTDELIHKLESLVSRYQARQLQQQVFLHRRAKTENETIYYNVDYLHTAIYTDVQIKFRYAEWNQKKELQLRKNGEFYVISPWALTWNDENYYLIAYDEQTEQIRHYRVDKMRSMELLDKKRLGREMFEHFDLVAFSKKTFGMFGGEEQNVTLRCENYLAGVILDRFGKNVMMVPKPDGGFTVNVPIAVSPQFFGWVTGLGEGIEILSPESVRSDYRDYLEHIRMKYQEA